MKQANHQGAERYIEKNVYRLPHVPLASLTESRHSDSHSQATDRIAQEGEEALASENRKQLYNITKKLTEIFGQAECPVKDKNKSVLVGDDKHLSRWAEHFEELLNGPAPANTVDISIADEDLTYRFRSP